jgi:hypothetical protein
MTGSTVTVAAHLIRMNRPHCDNALRLAAWQLSPYGNVLQCGVWATAGVPGRPCSSMRVQRESQIIKVQIIKVQFANWAPNKPNFKLSLVLHLRAQAQLKLSD